MNKKVFVFDMDGVLVRSEQEWENSEADLFPKMFGPGISAKLWDTIGVSVGEIYEKAVSLGATISKEKYYQLFDAAAQRVYGRCPITEGVEELVAYLKSHGWRLALASSSPLSWINLVLKRLAWKDKLDLVLSVNEHSELKPKPAPDGYQYILKTLGAAVSDSMALEDSNPGITSAKAAGLFTIGYTEHLVGDYQQVPADAVAKNMNEVIKILAEGIHKESAF